MVPRCTCLTPGPVHTPARPLFTPCEVETVSSTERVRTTFFSQARWEHGAGSQDFWIVIPAPA